jgi:nucleoside-diphosphate-sugar epimerase
VHHADVGQAILRALNGEPVAAEAAARPLDDPWEGIVDTTRIRRELGFRPIYPSVYTAEDAGAL